MNRIKPIAQQASRIQTQLRMQHTSYPKLPQITVNMEKAEAEIILPGYNYGDLDRYGNLKMSQVALNSDVPWDHFARHPDIQPAMKDIWWGMPQSKDLLFTISSQIDITDNFYDKENIDYPVSFTCQIANLGRTSYNGIDTATSLLTAKLLYTNVSHIVFVDKNTRRPKELPESLRSHFGSVIVPGCERFVQFDRADVYFKTKVIVKHSDTDWYKHANWSSYMKFIMDAMAEGVEQSYFSKIKTDAMFWKLKSLKGLYLNETKPCDVLDIYVWEDKEDPWKLLFHVNRAGDLVYQAVVDIVPSASPPFENRGKSRL